MKVSDKYRIVLIVDDDPDMREILQTALGGLGFTTYVADDGDVALDLFHKHRPALVVSDIFMPRFDGVRLLKEIKKVSRDTPVILITGYSHLDKQQEEDSCAFKPDALLRKPFNLSELVEAIHTIMND
ncbi:MAG: response regulator [bacterium]